jgi:AcrR family transcriptional regulator
MTVMARPATTEPAVAEDESTKAKILDAAMECFIQLGIAKTSVQDVARVARVSRGTVYRYFVDRQAIVEATVEHGARQYYADAAAAMRKYETLTEQVGALAEVVARTQMEHRTRNRLMDGDSALMHLMLSDHHAALRRNAEFLRPYVHTAKERGEIGADVDESEASEWLARLIMSFNMLQTSLTYDGDKPKAVRRFVERYAVNGLRQP